MIDFLLAFVAGIAGGIGLVSGIVFWLWVVIYVMEK